MYVTYVDYNDYTEFVSPDWYALLCAPATVKSLICEHIFPKVDVPNWECPNLGVGHDQHS